MVFLNDDSVNLQTFLLLIKFILQVFIAEDKKQLGIQYTQ